MIKRNKIMAKIMVVALIANTLPSVNALAAEKSNVTTGVVVETQNVKVASESDFEFNSLTGTITKYKGTDSDFAVPSEIYGVKVTAIGEKAFYKNQSLKKIILPDTITTIGNAAFDSCKQLESIKLPENLTVINGDTFEYCDSLKSITIPDKVTAIGSYAFYCCYELKDVKMPASIEQIGYGAFKDDSKLVEITLPDTVNYIGGSAFDNANSTKFNVSRKAVKNLLVSTGVSEEKINVLNHDYDFEDDCEFDVKTGTVTKYNGTDSVVVVPSKIKGVKVTAIAEKAFYKNQSLKKVTLPDTITTIGNAAFDSCKQLESIKLPENLTVINGDTFEYCDALKSVTIPDKVTAIGSYAFYCCYELQDVKMPASLQQIGYAAFENDSKLGEITLPDTVDYIGGSAFANANSAKFNVSRKSVKNLLVSTGVSEENINVINHDYDFEDDCEFDDKTGTVTKYKGTDSAVVVPSEIKGVKVTAIGEKAFYQNKSLKKITLPDTITTIGNAAFDSCKQLESIKLPENLTVINGDTFEYCDSLKSVTIPDKVTALGSYAFYCCYELQDVKMPASLQQIGYAAFENDSKLGEITLPNTVDYIAGSAFANDNSTKFNVSRKSIKNLLVSTGVSEENIVVSCHDYDFEDDCEFDAKTGTVTKYNGTDSEIVVPSEIKGVKVTAIAEKAFYKNQSLKKITLPDTITTIGNAAFDSCNQLESIKLPENLTVINGDTFEYCDALRSITIPDKVTAIGSYAFYCCYELQDVKMPASLEQIGYGAFANDNSSKFNVSSKAVKDLLLSQGVNEDKINLVSDAK